MLRQVVQVRSNGLILFEQPDSMSHERFNLQQQAAAVYSGTMTNHARKRLACAIDILVQRNPTRRIYNPISKNHHDFRLNFITLTVPTAKLISASWGYEHLLGKWIRYMRDKYGLREYIWKCELTEAQQPHWHITGNEFIPWPVVRWKWNNLLKQEGLLNKYAKQHGHFNAPSTEIKAVENVLDMSKYFCKEMCKTTFCQVANGDPVHDVRWNQEAKIYEGFMFEDLNPECMQPVSWNADYSCIDYPGKHNELMPAAIDGKVWDCSEVLKMGRFSAEMDRETSKRIWEARTRGSVKYDKLERCEIIKTLNPLALLSQQMLHDYRTYIN